MLVLVLLNIIVLGFTVRCLFLVNICTLVHVFIGLWCYSHPNNFGICNNMQNVYYSVTTLILILLEGKCGIILKLRKVI